MLVKIIQNFEEGRIWHVGETIDVPRATARRWIANHQAVDGTAVATPPTEQAHGAPMAVIDPPGWRWTTHDCALRRMSLSGEVRSAFDITTKIPAVTKTYWVDPTNSTGAASDAAAGTQAAPLLSLATALAKADVDQIKFILTGDYFGRTTKSWNNVQPTRSVSVINDTGYAYASINAGSAVLPTWVANGTYADVYKATITAANASGVTDLSQRVAHPLIYELTERQRVTLNAVRRPFAQLVKVADVATVAVTPGSWFHDGTDLHVRAHDSRNLVGDTGMQPTANTNNGRFPATTNLVVYIKGIDFVGGRPFYSTATEAANVTGTVLALNDCTFQGSGLANGLNVEMTQTVYLYRCGAFGNWNDGFNYHCPTSPTAAGLDISPKVFELECVSYNNGITGSTATSDNASTSHEYTDIVRVGCVYPNSADRVVVDINVTWPWLLNCHIGQSLSVAAGKESLAALDTCQMHADTCTVADGPNPKFTAESAGSKLSVYNCGPLTNASGASGSVVEYLA